MGKPLSGRRGSIRVVIKLTALTLVVVAASCQSVPPIWYQAGADAEGQTVTVIAASNAIFHELDGKELADPFTTWNGGYAAVREIRITPGKHSITGSIAHGNMVTPYRFDEDFEAGRYLVSGKVVGYGITPQLKRVESSQ